NAAVAPQEKQIALSHGRWHQGSVAIHLENSVDLSFAAVWSNRDGFIAHTQPRRGAEDQIAMRERRRDGAFDMALVEDVGRPVELAGRRIEARDAVLVTDDDQLRGRTLGLIDARRCVSVAALAWDEPSVLAGRRVDSDDGVFALVLAGQDHEVVVNDGR